jgi:hypothetical protein
MAKKVLVSYLERNKVFTIPDTAREEGVKEVQFLKLEFLKAFNLADDITADVVFQKYDEDWDTYIDLEAGDMLMTKDKLKAIVSHNVILQHTPVCGSVNTSIISVSKIMLIKWLVLFA